MLTTSFFPKSTTARAPIFSSIHHRRRLRPRRCLRFPPVAVDAVQSYDDDSRLSVCPHKVDLDPSFRKLKIAIVGFGNFGQFLAGTFFRQGHEVLAYSRSDHSLAAASLGVGFFPDAHDLCEQQPDVLLLSTSILSTSSVLRSLPLDRLRRNTLVVDVLSVKEFPRTLFLQSLPPDFDILCTHPMFGSESGRGDWSDLPFVYDRVRIGDSEPRLRRCEAFLEIFRSEGCRMVEMSCAEHDRHAAASQFVTHSVGRVLAKMGVEETPINTMGYERLLQLVGNTCKDSFDLYHGLFVYNKNSTELLKKLDESFHSVKKELLGKLHDVVREQLFESGTDTEDYTK